VVQPNRSFERSLAFSASASRSRAGAWVCSEVSSRRAASETSATARSNAAALACDGLAKPESYSHGHVFDFCGALAKDPSRLRVLGNGLQRKSYLYVQDCIDAMLLVTGQNEPGVRIFNLGADEYCTVNDSVGWITGRLGLKPHRDYTGGIRGWVGDSPFIFLDTKRVRSLGWQPKLTIRQGVERTVEYLQANQWLFKQRAA